ncbi:urease accessory protein UreD [Pseudooctadecabacter jejudonensis]|uniref:Urease accessory protein UreD n=1 Tax=Pseudooctadecabacter jejudonensis TaxID=1391910 RepID=A0A1Y5SS93_9RHOB|nr:urease accessory protein UreD [Pseudooctadecabacter jejudonensis]SLN43991.1 Urease accessory protein UreD [Pseudooctadecabacter jejudonensis]
MSAETMVAQEMSLSHLSSSADAPHVVQPRARGRLRVSSKLRDGRSVIDELHQAGSFKVVFPNTSRQTLEAVTVNTAGGITGGDRFNATFEAGADTQVTVTTQAAERAYRAVGPVAGSLCTDIAVQAGAEFAWLPQETILFDGARLKRRMQIDLVADAGLLFVEPLVFGRTARGEALTDVMFDDAVSIRRAGVPLFEDAVRLTGDLTAQMARRAGGAGALATLVYVGKDAEHHLGRLREMLTLTAGASLLAPDILHLRLLAPDSFILRQTLVPVLEHLRAGPLPRVWRI